MPILATNAVQIARFANALYGIQLGSATNAAVLADITAAGGLDNALNSYYTSSFGSKTSAQVAAVMVANLGIVAGSNGLTAAAVTDATNYIVATLNAAPAAGKGAAVKSILNLWANIADDATLASTYGAAATAWNANVSAAQAYTASNTADAAVGAVVSGQTFTLTTGVDNIVGTGNNDTIIADNTGTAKQLTVADAINGGAGTDTLKIYLAAGDTATGQPTTLTGIENVVINGGAVTAYTANSATTSLSVEDPVALTNATYTLSGQSVSLKSALTASAAATMTTTLANAATTTAANVTLNGYTYSGTDSHTLAITGAALATVNLSSTGAANKVASLTNASAALTTLNIDGDKALTLADALTGLKTYNAANLTGALTLDVSGKTPSSTLAITGGSGNDKVTFGAGAAGPKSTMAIAGGAGTDTLVIKDADTSNSAGINKVTGFEVLGLGATTTGTYDMSVITSLTAVNSLTALALTGAAGAAGTNAGTAATAGVTLTGLSNSNTVQIDANITTVGGAGGAHSVADGNNATGGAGAAGGSALVLTPAVDNGSNAITLTFSGVTLNSSGGAGGAATVAAGANNDTATGGAGGAAATTINASNYENVTIVSNKDATGAGSNTLTAAGGAGGAATGGTTSNTAGVAGADAAGLTVGTNATVTISGAAALNTGLIAGTNVTVNASALTGNLTMSTGTGNDVITGGSGINTITLTGGVDTVNLSASTAKADVIALTSGTGTTSTNFVKISGFTNAATTGDKLDTAIATVTIQADVTTPTATGVANLNAQVANGIMTFSGTAAATATLANKVTAATAAAFAGAVNEVLAFEHNGNTYVFAQVGTANAFDAGTDQLIELTGVVGLTALSTTASGATTLWIA